MCRLRSATAPWWGTMPTSRGTLARRGSGRGRSAPATRRWGARTRVRAIAGLWPWGEGEIMLKPGAKMFLMPQKPYIPLGTLRRAVTYPRHAEDFKDKQITDALKAVGLAHITKKLD